MSPCIVHSACVRALGRVHFLAAEAASSSRSDQRRRRRSAPICAIIYHQPPASTRSSHHHHRDHDVDDRSIDRAAVDRVTRTHCSPAPGGGHIDVDVDDSLGARGPRPRCSTEGVTHATTTTTSTTTLKVCACLQLKFRNVLTTAPSRPTSLCCSST